MSPVSEMLLGRNEELYNKEFLKNFSYINELDATQREKLLPPLLSDRSSPTKISNRLQRTTNYSGERQTENVGGSLSLQLKPLAATTTHKHKKVLL